MPLGKWGKALQNSGFNEVCYLGDYPVFMIWCNEKKYDFCDPSIEEKFTGLPAAEKDKLRDNFGNQIMGNCGELANYFLRYASVHTQRITISRPAEQMQQTLNSNQSGLFRISIGKIHTFIGVRSTTPGQEIEIIQAWQGTYSVKDWLNKNQNVFSIPEFINNLVKLSSPVDFREASEVLFSTLEKKNLLSEPTHVAKFAFRAFSPLEMDSILRGKLNPFSPDALPPHEADFYQWNDQVAI